MTTAVHGKLYGQAVHNGQSFGGADARQQCESSAVRSPLAARRMTAGSTAEPPTHLPSSESSRASAMIAGSADRAGTMRQSIWCLIFAWMCVASPARRIYVGTVRTCHTVCGMPESTPFRRVRGQLGPYAVAVMQKPC